MNVPVVLTFETLQVLREGLVVEDLVGGFMYGT